MTWIGRAELPSSGGGWRELKARAPAASDGETTAAPRPEAGGRYLWCAILGLNQ